ncbi:transglycosylase domain-containing protein [Erysipelothrix sp. D19-032]
MKKKKRKEPVAGKLKAQRITAWVLIVLTSLGVLGVATVGIYAGIQISKTTPLAHEDFIPTSSSTFYASNDQSFFETGYKLRDNIGYDDLSNSVIDAFIAIEDSRFFTHNGFDVPRFTRAALNNLKKTITSGRLDFSEGGSTFTMQLIKQTEFMSDGSDGEEVKGPDVGSSGISRKIQEIYLSQKIDGGGVLSKKLILELYLNQIDFGVGNNTVGIENSSKAYFGKSASELNTVEAAMMVVLSMLLMLILHI